MASSDKTFMTTAPHRMHGPRSIVSSEEVAVETLPLPARTRTPRPVGPGGHGAARAHGRATRGGILPTASTRSSRSTARFRVRAVRRATRRSTGCSPGSITWRERSPSRAGVPPDPRAGRSPPRRLDRGPHRVAALERLEARRRDETQLRFAAPKTGWSTTWSSPAMPEETNHERHINVGEAPPADRPDLAGAGQRKGGDRLRAAARRTRSTRSRFVEPNNSDSNHNDSKSTDGANGTGTDSTAPPPPAKPAAGRPTPPAAGLARTLCAPPMTPPVAIPDPPAPTATDPTDATPVTDVTDAPAADDARPRGRGAHARPDLVSALHPPILRPRRRWRPTFRHCWSRRPTPRPPRFRPSTTRRVRRRRRGHDRRDRRRRRHRPPRRTSVGAAERRRTRRARRRRTVPDRQPRRRRRRAAPRQRSRRHPRRRRRAAPAGKS